MVVPACAGTPTTLPTHYDVAVDTDGVAAEQAAAIVTAAARA